VDVQLLNTADAVHTAANSPHRLRESRTSLAYSTFCDDTRDALGDVAAFWHDRVSANHGSMRIRLGAAPVFRGRTQVQRNADHLLVDWWSDAVHYTRTDADVRADDRRGYILMIPHRGAIEVEQGEEQMRLRPGQGVMFTMARAAQVRQDSWVRAWTLDTSDPRLRDAIEHRPVLLDLQSGLGSVVRTMISSVGRQHGSLDGYEFARCCATINDLLHVFALDRGGLPDTLGSVELAVREYVARHAYDPDLTPRTVARSLGWSVRQVQLALQRAGTTTSDLIRSTRVTRAADLLHRAPPNTTITSIAFACGFRSMTTFEVVFKKYFGLTPSEARMLCSASDVPPPAATPAGVNEGGVMLADSVSVDNSRLPLCRERQII
jgi:AraC-like DNA-binding protein